MHIVYSTPPGANEHFRIELAPVVLDVVSHANCGVLAGVMREWLRVQGWRTPVIILTGCPPGGSDQDVAPGVPATCNAAHDPALWHAAILSRGRMSGTFDGYAQFPVRVNEEFWQFLPEG